MFQTKIKINRKVRLWLSRLVVISLAAGGTFLLFQYNSNTLVSKAANSVVFSSGQVSIDKKYYNGVSEVESLSVNTNASVTVRLKYNNTGNSSANTAKITDSLPAGFNLVTGSVKNCYSDLSCVNLNDNLFAAGSLSVAPAAGYFGNVTNNTLSTSNLEMGKKKYIKVVSCQETNGDGDWFSPSGSDGAGGTLGVSNSPLAVTLTQMQANTPGYCSGVGESFVAGVFLARGNRFIHEVKCQSSTPVPYFGDWKIPLNNNVQSVSLGVNNLSTPLNHSDILYETPSYCIDSGETFLSQVLDNLNKRYIHQVKCVDPVFFGDMYIPGNPDGVGGTLGLGNTATLLTKTQIQITEPTFCTGGSQTFESNVQDSLDANNGYGYIEYRMTATATGGLFGTDASMSGSFSNTDISDPAPFSISVGTDLVCPYIFPANGVRNITLGDAELRTDQDFTCNYVAKICVTVFQDNNSDGVQNGVESRLGGITVKLLSQDGLTEIYSISSVTSGLQCFEPLLNNKIYKVQVINPPSPNSTTGGNVKEVGVTYQTGTNNIAFGYSVGSISLTAEETVTLGSIPISSTPQEVCTTIHDIQVVDTRNYKPGWSVTATVNNFVDSTNSSNTIPVAGRVELKPKTVTIVSGNSTGISPGQTRTISSTTDSVSVFAASSDNGLGTFKTDMDLCLTVPAFSKLGQYYTTVNFVV
jgi:uncharacterized repeat protein (TIGR01451 family)